MRNGPSDENEEDALQASGNGPRFLPICGWLMAATPAVWLGKEPRPSLGAPITFPFSAAPLNLLSKLPLFASGVHGGTRS
jgi:hypothetical protein